MAGRRTLPRRIRTRWAFVLATLAIVSSPVAAQAPADTARAHGSAAAGPIELRDELLRLVNRARARHGVEPLRLNAGLSESALEHSDRMARQHKLFHTPNLDELISEWGGSTFGENLAQGRSLHAVVQEWLRGSSTRENVLGARFRRAALGVVHPGGSFWVTFWPYA
jgi:uncharacterized protein YkwD